MSKLEALTVGSRVNGIISTGSVTIQSAKWFGSAVLEVIYKTDNGSIGNTMLYRENENELEVVEQNLPWSFDADGALLRLVSEAYRINLAHIFDPYLAVHTSAIDPLPHQISAVYENMLPRLPLRYILADDPGAGKTIMTGLLLKELIVRGDLKRCMIVCPGNLAEQWQDELYRKFGLRFDILTNDRIESSVTGNVFTECNHVIVRLDKLSRSDTLQEKLRITDWDLVVVDEAHKMSATVFGGEVSYTKRFQLGRLLSSVTQHYLLLTATPHNGKDPDFQLFLSLIDQDRFEGTVRSSNQSIDVSDIMRRLVKEELLTFEGKPLFPERRAYTVNYTLSPLEEKLYFDVTDYVQREFNRAENINTERKNTVGFALTILQRRLASSPEAIYQSLRRRRERLENRLAEELLGQRAQSVSYGLPDDLEDEEDLPSNEAEAMEEEIADQASAASTIKELEAEILILKRLENMANAVRVSGEDRKWDELSRLLQDNPAMFGEEGKREKLIIFTEHRDTLNYLKQKIGLILGDPEAVVTIHGGMLRDERRKVEELFKQDKNVRVLVATDAAGEGINLQRAHLMVNYDLPWNPNRLEQRFGRIHRIGQTEVCHLWNLVAKETREGAVFQRLFEKLEEERNALGGKVFDILGKLSFNDRPLRELLIEAIRYGDRPGVRAKLNRVVDNSLDHKALDELLREHALTEDVMDVHRVMAIKEEMERMEAHKLQPHFIQAFFVEAFQSLGGVIRPREEGRMEIISVPFAVRNRDMQIGFGEPVLQRYERVCFDKAYCNVPGLTPAALITPGHPLLEATIDLFRERSGDVLKRGTIFVDETDPGDKLRVLYYIEDAIQDEFRLPSGAQRVVSRHVHFVEMSEDGAVHAAGYAPYLDYRPLRAEEAETVRAYAAASSFLHGNIEEPALHYAIAELIPPHYRAVKARKEQMTDKIAKAVKARLTAEIQYWDYRAADLRQKEAAGKVMARINADQAAKRAEELEARMQKRLAELEKERHVSPLSPVVVGGALIVPQGLLSRLTGQASPSLFSADRDAVEQAAMKAVMAIERELGFDPVDVSMTKCGYDVESSVPEHLRGAGACLRLIEVKGRRAGAATVTVTKNEIIAALNRPEGFILAVVEVDGARTRTTYLRKPFTQAPDFGATSVNYDIADLMRQAEILLTK